MSEDYCLTFYNYFPIYYANFHLPIVPTDDNECKLGIANCGINSLCHNQPGTFTCECLRGYVGDGVNCRDVDECAHEKMNDCARNANCENNEGSYVCTCKKGYEGNGRECFSEYNRTVSFHISL